MRLYAPKYYLDFSCVADKCKHSCCVGWEIDIDPETCEKYKNLNGGYGEQIKNSVAKRGTPRFLLKRGNVCPHLDERGLCKIIINLGEEYLCEICSNHPRFYNVTPYGVEVGLGLCCEEACRIILSSDDYDQIGLVGEVEEDYVPSFNPVLDRVDIYKILKDKTRSLDEKIVDITQKYALEDVVSKERALRSVIGGLEYLDITNKSRFLAYSNAYQTPKGFEKVVERFLAYLLYRHVPKAESKSEVKSAVGFALILTRIFISVLTCEKVEELSLAEEIARTVSEEIEYSEDNTERIKFLI